MKAFLSGLAVLIVLAVAVGFTYRGAAVSSSGGFSPSPAVHAPEHG